MYRMPMAEKGRFVNWCGVSFVPFPSVLRMLQSQCLHVLIAMGLGQYAGRRDGEEPTVSLDFTSVGYGMGPKSVSVNQEVIGTSGQAINGPMHGQISGLQDVYPFNFLDGSPSHAPSC